MAAKRVAYHQDALTDVKSAVAWYREHSRKATLDFIDELNRAAETIREAPERWPMGKNNTRRFLLWRFPFACYLFREGLDHHNLGRRSWQQTPGVLDTPTLTRAYTGSRRAVRPLKGVTNQPLSRGQDGIPCGSSSLPSCGPRPASRGDALPVSGSTNAALRP